MLSQYPKLRSGCLLFLLVLISGCATRQPLDEVANNTSWQIHRDKLYKLHNWELKGRIAIQLEQEAWSASVYWHQQQEVYNLRIIAPLGQGTYELYGDQSGVSLRTAENKLFEAKDVESLLREHLGWYVPLSGLVYWVRGVPEPGNKAETLLLDKRGRMINLTQSGWHVSCTRYLSRGIYTLPGKIIMENDKLKLRLVIRDWDIKV